MGSFDCYFQGNSVALQSRLMERCQVNIFDLPLMGELRNHYKIILAVLRFDDLHGCRAKTCSQPHARALILARHARTANIASIAKARKEVRPSANNP